MDGGFIWVAYMDVVVKDVYGSWCLVLGGDGGVVGYCWDILARVPVLGIFIECGLGFGCFNNETCGWGANLHEAFLL